MSRPVRILLLAARAGDRALVRTALEGAALIPEIVEAGALADATAELDRGGPTVVVACGGAVPYRELAKLAENRGVDIPVIALADAGQEDAGLAAMDEGARDVVFRDRLARLPRVVLRELAVAEDRGTRRLAERDLASSEERFRLLAEHAKDIIYRCRFLPDKVVEYISPSVVALTGYAPAEYYADPDLYTSIIHPEDRPFLEQAMRQATTSTGPVLLRWTGRNGRVIWTEQSITRILDHDGNVVAIEGIARNVSKRVRIETALRESEQRLQNVLRSMIDPLFVVGKDGVVQVVNAAVEALLGYAPRELIGHPIGRIADEHALAPLLAGELVSQLDLVLRASSGEAIPVQLNGSPMRDPSGAVVGAVGVVRDMREARRLMGEAAASAAAAQEKADELARALHTLRETQEQLVQTSRLASLGQLAAGIAHDFNNLLTTIFGYTDLALDQLDEDEPLRDDLTEIKLAANRAAKLVSQLLAFARRQTLQPRLVDLAEWVRGAERLLQPLLGQGIALEVLADAGAAVVRVDPSQLEQVLVNLAANARDSMPEGGHLSLAVDGIALDEEYVRAHPDTATGEYVRLSVTDTGRGMAPEVRARIFEPFFTTKGLARASGLGLATVYGTVKQSGGFIWVYSEENRGTTFKIYLPRVRDVSAPRPSGRPTASAPGGNERVLVVEDENALRDLAAKTLRKHGYEVLEAIDGLDALEKLAATPRVDLVVTDVIMPRMGGQELAERLAAERPELPLVFVSGFADTDLSRDGKPVHYLQKPFAPSELLKLVREALDARRSGK